MISSFSGGEWESCSVVQVVGCAEVGFCRWVLNLARTQDKFVFKADGAQLALNLFFFPFQPLILVLLDITPMMTVLEGVVMELQDCALPLLRGGQNNFFFFSYTSKVLQYSSCIYEPL